MSAAIVISAIMPHTAHYGESRPCVRNCCRTIDMTIRQLSSRVVYRNPWMTVREDEIERDNGAHGIYGVVEKCDSALVLAIDNDQIYLVEQYRYPLGVKSLEFPQGSLERPDIDPAEIAREELQAETG